MRRRRLVALLTAALAVGATACAPTSSARLTATPDAAIPLDARIFPPHFGQVALHLSKPAYVALFEVVPGRGASLLYPQHGTGFVQVAETWVPMRYNAQRWLYASNANSSYAGYAGYGRVFGSSQFQPVPQAPRYLFLIASESPIAVERFQDGAGAVRRELGYSQYTSMRADETMERLALAVLPYESGDGWVSDVYVDWGFDWGTGVDFGIPAAFTSMQPVLCANGALVYVPWTSGWGFQNLPCTPIQWVPGTVVPNPPVTPGDTAAPPAGEGRRRSEGNSPGERRRDATATLTSEADIRAFMDQQLEQGRRVRMADQFNESLRKEVLGRQRADMVRGGSGPVVTRDATGRPAPAAGTARTGSSGTDERAARLDADRRRRATESAQADRDRREAADRRRRDRVESTSPAATSRREPSAERGRSSPPPQQSTPPTSGSSGSSGSSGGRTRVPPPGGG